MAIKFATLRLVYAIQRDLLTDKTYQNYMIHSVCIWFPKQTHNAPLRFRPCKKSQQNIVKYKKPQDL